MTSSKSISTLVSFGRLSITVLLVANHTIVSAVVSSTPLEVPPPPLECPSTGINPSEYILPARFDQTNYCYKIQAANGGKLFVDKEDTGCANFGAGNRYGGVPISTYQRTDPGGIAVFEGKWSGSIALFQDLSLGEAIFEVSGNTKTKTFSGTLTVPVCNSACESISPSEYILPAILRKTNHCYKIQVHHLGKLFVDKGDTGCANFNAGSTYNGDPISAYQWTDPGGEAIYEGKWSGSILLKQNSSLSEAKFEVSGNSNTKTFSGTLTVPGCISTPAPAVEVEYVGNPCTSFSPGRQCAECTGDCDSDSDCAGNLRCAQRRSSGGEEIVPGCVWGPNSDSLRFDDSDYCFLPISQPGVINYVGECSSRTYRCGLCEGDCDSDSSCEGDLVCVERSGYNAVQGCTGEGGSRDMYDKDVCAPAQIPTSTPPSPTPDYLNSLLFNNNGCSAKSPCSKCEGPCNTSNDCEAELVCFERSGSESVPGCVTGGSGDVSGTNYCHEEFMDGMPTYIPGDLTKKEKGLVLSTGLSARIIARTGEKVSYTNGGKSSSKFHVDPDAGAVFEDTSKRNAGGWIYVSNSEESDGGVGAIRFNSNGDVINYKMILENTSQNCGGGKTYWGTWVTCEENGSSGQVWEVDPALPSKSQRNTPTVLGGTGGNYESFAYDARDRFNPTFYVTNDSSFGSLVRFTPDPNVVRQAEQTGDYSNVLRTGGTLQWLMLDPVSGSASDASGTFSWTTSRTAADSNSNRFYRNSEGIDIRDGMLYFVTKRSKHLYILDLDALTYTKSSTVSGAFDGQPDQIKRILDQDPKSDMLYFCEDNGSDSGVHARDYEGNFFTIIDSDTLSSESTGLAFSPDNKHMYISYQDDGIIYDIVREDGYPFGSMRLDIKYHAD